MVEIPSMPTEPGRDVVDAVCTSRRPDFRSLTNPEKDALREDALSWLRCWRDQSVPVVPASPVRDRVLAVLMERDACAVEILIAEGGGSSEEARRALAERIRERPIEAPASIPQLPAVLERRLREEIAREFLACSDGYRDRNREWADKLFEHVDETGHHGDCGKVASPAPYTCSACVIEEAYRFADGILGAVSSAATEETEAVEEPRPTSVERKRRLAVETREMRALTSYEITDDMADMAISLLGDHFRSSRGRDMQRYIARRAISGALKQLPLPLERIAQINALEYKIRHQREAIRLLGDENVSLKEKLDAAVPKAVAKIDVVETADR